MSDWSEYEMSPDWSILPLLPLRCVMEHLSLEDALSAMSTCRHWRSSILLYEGRKESIRMSARELEKSVFIARIFRKHIHRLHVYLDRKEEDILDEFMSYVLPIFFDTLKLREIVFIGPSYIQQNHHVPVVKLKRLLTESLIFKHLRNLQRLALLGCEMELAKGETKKMTSKHTILNEYYSRPLSFSRVFLPSARSGAGGLPFSALQHLLVDYEHINTASLESLSQLATLSQLSLNIGYKQQLEFAPIDWLCVDACFPNRLKVSVNIVSLPHTKIDEVMENVLGEGMMLVSLKVMFCKILYPPLIEHVVRLHKETLTELVWADSPYNSNDVYHRDIRPTPPSQYGVNNVNPLILLCWQCPRLKRLAIHGYWIWQYDLLGFVRLSQSLEQLEVSSIHDKQDEYGKTTPRVLAADQQPPLYRHFVQEVNRYTSFPWAPIPWKAVHPALRAYATPCLRSDYVVRETLRPLPPTEPLTMAGHPPQG